MSDDIRLEALFNFVVACLAQAEQSSQRDIGRLLGARNGKEARTLFLAFQGGRKKTVGDIVSILSGLRTNVQNSYLNDADDIRHAARLISAEHIYLALQKLIALTPEERESLNLPVDACEVLLNQAFINMALYQRPWNEDRLLAIYRASISLNQDSTDQTSIQPSRADIYAWVEQAAEDYQRNQLGFSTNNSTKEIQLQERTPITQLNVLHKAKQEIERILLKTGAGHLQLDGVDSREDYVRRYFSRGFIKRLTQAVTENELLTEELPIFIRNVTVERCGPFPLQTADTLESGGVLSRTLLNFDRKSDDDPDYTELSSHTVNRVTVQMYMRLPVGAQQSLSPFTSAQLVRKGNQGDELNFEVSSTGIGGTFSHVVRILNQLLLYDIDCLRSYFPIAHEIMMEQDIIRSGAPAPIVAHSLVKLCKVYALSRAMQASQKAGSLKSYELFSFDDPIGRGDFCGFDTLASVANAALQARLKVIKLTGSSPQTYLSDLQYRIDKLFLLEKSCSYLTGYPFSSLAQQSFLQAALGNKWNCSLTREDPYIYFEVQIEVIEMFLAEGFHGRIKSSLSQLSSTLEAISNQGIAWYDRFGNDIELDNNFHIFSGMLLVRYELCQASYHYLTNSPEEAWRRLQRAESHLNIRLAKYSLIHEVSQATFHPHYRLLAQIYFLRARLLLFFPFIPEISRTNQGSLLATDVEHRNGLRTTRAVHVGRLYLFEKARLYAACNGDSELYACLTAYQSCIYLITAGTDVIPIQKLGSRSFTLTADQARDWAYRLRNEALLSYSEAGRRYYYQIKEKSGISEQRHHDFGRFTIDTVPAIREQRGDEEPGVIEFLRRDDKPPEKVLYLDMSILGLDEQIIRGIDTSERGNTIYLFGTNSCYLFFARGMFHLCSNNLKEFGESPVVKSLDDWIGKLAHAYRLFSYAWAIADDSGCVVSERDGDQQIHIQRSFVIPDSVAESDKDVASIQALYPHRITDIASLGRLYAATCAVLRGYTTTDEREREKYHSQLNWLLANLHSEDSYNRPGTQKLMGGQKRYNEHLYKYLRRCRYHIYKEWQNVLSSSVSSEKIVQTRRNEILERLFSVRAMTL